MIINRPDPTVFEKLSTQYLAQSINLIYEKDRDLDYVDDEDRLNHWEYHQGLLGNSLILLFLSLENYLKAELCRITPMLLIADDPKNWGGLGNDKDFRGFYLYSFDSLLMLHIQINSTEIDARVISDLKELQDKRNTITHGILSDTITPQYVLRTFYGVAKNIFVSKDWSSRLREHIVKEPLFGIYDSNIELASLTYYVDFLVRYLGPKNTGEILGANLEARWYCCPSCHHWLNREDDSGDSKYAVLEPNEPLSTNVFCVVCGRNYAVIRQDCNQYGCPGNVIYNRDDTLLCLTCFEDQVREDEN